MMLDTTTEERRAARRRRRERLASQDRDVNITGHRRRRRRGDDITRIEPRPPAARYRRRGDSSLATTDGEGGAVPAVDEKAARRLRPPRLRGPHARLVVCAIPKVGSTELARLILRMGNSSHWRRDPQRSALAVVDRDKHLVSKLSLQRAQALVDDRRYTWAVFFRDPAHRLLSAYRNRILGRGA